MLRATMGPIGACQPVVVDNVQTLSAAVDDLATKSTLYVDCEGEDLSRYGALYTVQLYDGGPERRVYLMDIDVLGMSAFSSVSAKGNTLRALLQSKRVVMFDPRSDVDSLWNLFQVFPENVLCLQLAEIAYRRRTQKSSPVWEPPFVSGLSKCIDQHCTESLTPNEMLIKNRVSNELKAGKFQYSDFKLSNARNSEDLQTYACVDVLSLPELERKVWQGKLCNGGERWVREHSRSRCARAKEHVAQNMFKNRDNAKAPTFTYRHHTSVKCSC